MGLTKPSEEEQEAMMLAYALWGKFIELSGTMIPWTTVEQLFEPQTTELEEDEHGKLYETVIRITHRGVFNEETEQD